MACENTRDCPCTVNCPRHGIRCACVAHHRDKEGGIPRRLFTKEGEAARNPSRESLAKGRAFSRRRSESVFSAGRGDAPRFLLTFFQSHDIL